MDKENDKVLGLFVRNRTNLEEVKHTFDEHLSKDGVSGEFFSVDRTERKPVWQSIMSWINDADTPIVDFIVVGNKGADYSSHKESKYIGSVAFGVIGNAKNNILFVV